MLYSGVPGVGGGWEEETHRWEGRALAQAPGDVRATLRPCVAVRHQPSVLGTLQPSETASPM